MHLGKTAWARVFRASILFVFTTSVFLACKSEAPKGGVATSAKSAEERVAAEYPIVQKLPASTSGFLVIDLKHDAAKRYKASPFATKDLLSVGDSIIAESKLLKVLSNSGLPLGQSVSAETVVPRVSVFVAPGTGAEAKPAVGIIFEGGEALTPEAFFGKLKGELAREGVQVDEQKFGEVAGYSFDVTKLANAESAEGEVVAREPLVLFTATKGGLGILGTSRSIIEGVLANVNGSVPAIINNDRFKKSLAGFPAFENVFALGYFDMQDFLQAALISSSALSDERKNELKDLPLASLAFAASMEDTPKKYVRVNMKPDSQGQVEALKGIANSQSTQLVKLVPQDAFVFLSLDGTVVKQMRDAALATAGGAADADILATTKLLDSVKRVGVFARTAPTGEAMIPIPNIGILFESDKGEELERGIVTAVGDLAKKNGLPASAVRDSQVDGVKVKSFMTPLGVGVSIGRLGGVVTITSSEGLLKSLVGESKKGDAPVLAALPGEARNGFRDDQTLGNMVLNFHELGTFVENLQGMLSMFAPQADQGTGLASAETIAELKKMGVLVGSLKSEKDSFFLTSSDYLQQAKPAS